MKTIGDDLVRSLLKRYCNSISQCVTTNILKVCAEVSTDIINEYFNNLEVVLNGILPENIFNLMKSISRMTQEKKES